MTTFENIEGPRLLKIFYQLSQKKTLVRVSVPDNAFESLTVITQPNAKDANTYFCISPPKGLAAALATSKARFIYFEYNSEDRVTHRFEAEIANISVDNVKLHIPDMIQRHQQRDNFRVKVFYDAYAKLQIDDIDLRMPIDNVSLGGVFCLCKNKYKSKFSEKQILNNLELFFTIGKECFLVAIEQVQVNRFENVPTQRHFGIAFEFVRIKRSQKKILVQQIYDLQRYFLKNRLKSH